MTKWGPLWNGDTSSPRFAAMVEMTWLGVRTWEEVLLMPDMPWAQYVTPEQRRGLKRFVDACRAHATWSLTGKVRSATPGVSRGVGCEAQGDG